MSATCTTTPSTYSDVKDVTVTIGDESKSLVNHRVRKPSVRKKPHKCATCGPQFDCLSKLTVHIRSHTGEKPFKCDVCGSCFSHNSGLNKHVRTHSGEKPFTCDMCCLCVANARHLKVNMRSHTGEKPFIICHLC